MSDTTMHKYVLRIYRVSSFPENPTLKDEEALAYGHAEASSIDELASAIAEGTPKTIVITPNAVHYPPEPR